jgi:hypothetical protein
MKNTAWRYTPGGHSRKAKSGDTTGSYTHEEHSREIHTWRTQQRI